MSKYFCSFPMSNRTLKKCSIECLAAPRGNVPGFVAKDTGLDVPSAPRRKRLPAQNPSGTRGAGRRGPRGRASESTQMCLEWFLISVNTQPFQTEGLNVQAHGQKPSWGLPR